jgi:molecular chaperone DnaJ
MAKNYYDILGVDKKASKDEIKKAFHKLAHKYHPDKTGGDSSKFKEVTEAYSILSDEKKRAEYDSYGRVFSGGGGGPQGGAQGFDFNDFASQGGFQGFDDLNLGDIFSEFFGGGMGVRQNRGSDISIEIRLTFKEAIFGINRTVKIAKTSTCDTCKGNGAKKGSELVTCSTCNGKGNIHENRRSFFGTVTTNRACTTCHGTGKIPKEKCDVCKGVGVVHKQEEISLDIPAGIEDGEVMRLTGLGEAVPHGTPGDLYVKIRVEPHKLFRKEGVNLTTDFTVKLSDALLGTEYAIETLDGPITVKIPELVSFGEVLRVKGKGVPYDRNKRGDLLIRITISMPQKLNKKGKELISELKKEGL